MLPETFLNLPIVDYLIVPAGWLAGNIIFNNFEKHLPLYKRFFKFIATTLVIYLVGYFFGRVALYSALLFMVLGMVALHVWWFPKNGINGLTAEPYSKYLDLIGKIKRGSLSNQSIRRN